MNRIFHGRLETCACESESVRIRIRAVGRRGQVYAAADSSHSPLQLPPTHRSLSKMSRSRPFRPFSITTNSQSKRNGSPGPPSPTFSDTTNASAVHFGENGPAKVITRSDLKNSMQTYENVSTRLVVRLRPQSCRTLILSCTTTPEYTHPYSS